MKKFKGFTNQQTHTLLKEMGYTGPAQKDDMDAFLASSPSAASKLGRYTEIAKQRVEGGPLSGIGMQAGGQVDKANRLAELEAEATLMRRPDSNSSFDMLRGNTELTNAGIPGYQPVSRITPASTRMVGSPVDELGRPELRTVTKPGEQVTQIPPPEGAQVLKPGTPTPETTQPSIDLDAAQKAYSDAMGQLTDAQKALSGVSVTGTLDETTGRYKPTASSITEELGDRYGSNIVTVGGISPWVNTDYISMIESMDMPEDPADYELQFENNQYQIKYGDGKIIKLGTDENTTADIFAKAYAAAIPRVKESKSYADIINYNQLLQNVEDADLLVTQTQADVATKQKQFETTDIPSTAEALGKAISTPSSILAQPTVYGLKVENNQLIDEDTGQVATAATLLVKQAQAADAVEDPKVKATMAYVQGLSEAEIREKYPPYSKPIPAVTPLPPEVEKDIADYYERQQAQIEQDAIADRAETYNAVVSQDKVKTALDTLAAATGTPSEDALMKAETMDPEDLAQLDLDAETLDIIREIPEIKRQLDAGEIPTAALFDEYTASEAARLEGVTPEA